MLSTYDDLFALAARLGEKPRWFDSNGAPRFCDHHPDHCPNIYARGVALLLIACQRCGAEASVQLSSTLGHGDFPRSIEDGTIAYGDPPTHDVPGSAGTYCHAGCTMSSWTLRVLEFWRARGTVGGTWERVPALEIELPDTHDTHRIGVPA